MRNLVKKRVTSRERKGENPVSEDLIKEVWATGNESLQEERRLFYVAMTRARDKLFLTASRIYGDGKRDRKLSQFVSEALGEESVKSVLKKNVQEVPVQQLSLLDIANFQAQNSKEENKSVVSNQQAVAINYISYSQLATFKVCPLHYKLRYILNLPSAPSPALSYGISVHSTLRDILLEAKTKKDFTSEELKDFLDKRWINEGYSGKLHEQKTHKQAEGIIEKCWVNYKIEKPETIGIETPFNFWMTRTDVKQDKIKIAGRIDRIDKLPDGRIEIIDYKTGKAPKPGWEKKAIFQLQIYALIYWRNHGVVPKLLQLIYLGSAQLLRNSPSESDLLSTEKKLLQIAGEITDAMQDGKWTPTPSRLCDWCSFKGICPAFND